MKEPTQICRGFTDEQWKRLRTRLTQPDGQLSDDEAAWMCAVEVFERRIRERFLSCVEALEKADSRSRPEVGPGAPADCSTLPKDAKTHVVVPGFSIMALCCLLIETLQSFREAPKSSAPGRAVLLPSRALHRSATPYKGALQKVLGVACLSRRV
jgi:hypothetical protein